MVCGDCFVDAIFRINWRVRLFRYGSAVFGRFTFIGRLVNFAVQIGIGEFIEARLCVFDIFFGNAFFVALVRDDDFRFLSENLDSLCEGLHDDGQRIEHIADLFTDDAIADVDVIVTALVV